MLFATVLPAAPGSSNTPTAPLTSLSSSVLPDPAISTPLSVGAPCAKADFTTTPVVAASSSSAVVMFGPPRDLTPVSVLWLTPVRLTPTRGFVTASLTSTWLRLIPDELLTDTPKDREPVGATERPVTATSCCPSIDRLLTRAVYGVWRTRA